MTRANYIYNENTRSWIGWWLQQYLRWRSIFIKVSVPPIHLHAGDTVFRVLHGFPWEFLYLYNLVITVESLEELHQKFVLWKFSMDIMVLHVNFKCNHCRGEVQPINSCPLTGVLLGSCLLLLPGWYFVLRWQMCCWSPSHIARSHGRNFSICCL